LTGLAAVLLLLGSAAPTRAAPLGLILDAADLRAQVKEPVFAWVFALVDADSLGAWGSADLQAFSAAWEQPSDFPVERLVSFRREALPEPQRIVRSGLVCDRLVTITLDAPRLDMPMPYSILGYHPGTLSFGSPVVVREWRVGEREVTVRDGGGSRRATVRGLIVFELIEGWTVLDVDGWLDSLLGRNLDDAATVGFAVTRGEGRILGVGNSVGREGRFIYGELDFREGTVAPHGRPLARAVAGLVRRWSDPPATRRSAVWDGYDAATE
jgi:hypothetical protein